MMLLVLGMQLAQADRPTTLPVVGSATIARLFVAPVLAFAGADLVGLSGAARQAAILQASTPRRRHHDDSGARVRGGATLRDERGRDLDGAQPGDACPADRVAPVGGATRDSHHGLLGTGQFQERLWINVSRDGEAKPGRHHFLPGLVAVVDILVWIGVETISSRIVMMTHDVQRGALWQRDRLSRLVARFASCSRNGRCRGRPPPARPDTGPSTSCPSHADACAAASTRARRRA